MKILAFATTKAWTIRRPNAGKYFKAEMYAAAECWRELGHEVTTVEIEHKKHHDVRWLVIEEICKHKTVDCVAFFAHGTPRWLYGAGINVFNCGRLATNLKHANTKLVIIYSCSCGRSKGEWPGYKMTWKNIEVGKTEYTDGVALRLADEIACLGNDIQIIAHTTSGDTTRNPFAVSIIGKPGYKITRMPIITRLTGKDKKSFPHVVKRWKAWIKALRKTDLRYRFPFMKNREIITELDRGSNDTRNETE